MTSPALPLDPQAPPPAVTPAASASDPAAYASVTPHGQGPAPYSITAPLEDLSGVVAAAGALTGAGVVYPQSPRQAASAVMLDSPEGFGLDGYDIQQGYSGTGDGPGGWPNDVEPTLYNTPDQGTGDYPDTV